MATSNICHLTNNHLQVQLPYSHINLFQLLACYLDLTNNGYWVPVMDTDV